MLSPIKKQFEKSGHDTLNASAAEGTVTNQTLIETSAVKKNALLTPLLLSIPVIIILFILLSGSFSGFTSSVESEGLRENIGVGVHDQMNVAGTQSDSTLTSNKTLLVPVKK